MIKPDAVNAAYCLDLVKASDLDRYLSTLLANPDRQRALFAIYALDAELCGIAGQVSEPTLGEIRLQWWRDVIDDIYAGISEHNPVARELLWVVNQCDLPKELFFQLIDARQSDLYQTPMQTLQDLKNYLHNTSAIVTDLAARILIGNDVLEIGANIEKAGFVHGLGKQLFELPARINRKQCFVPLELLAQHGLNESHLLAREYSPDMQQVISTLCQQIESRFKGLRRDQSHLEKAVLPAFYPASLATLMVKKLIADKSNPLSQSETPSQLKMQWHLLKCVLFNRL